MDKPKLLTHMVNIIGPAILLVGIIGFVLTSLIGIGRSSPAFIDFDCFYTAGLIWRDGGNPYDIETYLSTLKLLLAKNQLQVGLLDHGQFAYPPMFAPFCITLAMLPYPEAKMVMLGLNLLAMALLALLTIRLVTDAELPQPTSKHSFAPWLLASFIIFNPSTTRAFWLGQTSIIAAALIVGAWYFTRRQKELIGGLLLGMAIFKPQLMVLPALWLLLERRWLTIFTAAVVAILLAAYPFLMEGPVSVIRDWLHALSVYSSEPINQPGSRSIIGLPSMMVAAGLPTMPLLWALLAAVGVMIALWQVRSRFCPDDLLAILIAIQVGMVYAHTDSLISLLAPAAAALWLHLADRPVTWPWAALLIFLLYIPDRIMIKSGVPLLTQWLTAVVILILGTLIYLNLRGDATRIPARCALSKDGSPVRGRSFDR